jgi:hypothetical protein
MDSQAYEYYQGDGYSPDAETFYRVSVRNLDRSYRIEMHSDGVWVGSAWDRVNEAGFYGTSDESGFVQNRRRIDEADLPDEILNAPQEVY